MSRPNYTDEFKQGVVQYIADHPEESKIAVSKRFGISDATVHKWLKDAGANNGVVASRGSGNFPAMRQKKSRD